MSDFSQLVRQVQSAVDLVEVVSEHVALKRRGKNYVGLCPFHVEKTASFTVSPEKRIYKCFGCGAGGDAIKFVQNIQSIGFIEALQLLAQRGGVRISLAQGGGMGGDGVDRLELFKVNQWAQQYYVRMLWDQKLGQEARKYLLGRGLKQSVLEQFSVGYAPGGANGLVGAAGKAGFSQELLVAAGLTVRTNQAIGRDLFNNRVIFPIHNASGQVVGFGGRVLNGGQPKYLNTPETAAFSKSRCLFGLHQGYKAIQDGGQVIVVEGYTDCLAAHQFEIQNVVATLGTALTDQHVRVLKRYCPAVVLLFDSDTAGQAAAQRALEIFLRQGVEVRLAGIGQGKDPFDLLISEGQEGLEGVLKQAVGALEFKWRQVLTEFRSLAGPAGKRAAIDELLRTVGLCAPSGQVDAVQRGLILAQVSNLLSVPAEQLAGRMQQLVGRERLGADRQDGQDQTTSAMPEPNNALETAYKELLEVLIAEPGTIALVRERDGIKLEEFSPAPLDQVARIVWQCYDQLGEFSLAELISFCREPSLASVVTQLHQRGTSRGNYQQTMKDALDSVDQYHERRQVEQLTQQVLKAGSGDQGEDVSQQALMALHKRLRNSGGRGAAVLGGH